MESEIVFTDDGDEVRCFRDEDGDTASASALGVWFEFENGTTYLSMEFATRVACTFDWPVAVAARNAHLELAAAARGAA